MKRDKLQQKDEYTGEETLEIVAETLHQIQMELQNKKFDLQDRKEEPRTSKLEKAAIDREIKQVMQSHSLISSYMNETKAKYLTECCDAPIKYYALNTRGQCSECGNDLPDTYEKEPAIQDLIKFLNNKIDGEG